MFSLWVYLNLISNYKDSQILWEGKQRVIKPGECVIGVPQLAKRWGVSRRVITKWLHHLRDTSRIVLETCPRGTHVTICNWEVLQNSQDESFPQRSHNVPTTGHLVKKERKKEEIHTSTPSPHLSDPSIQIAELWNNYSAKELPKVDLKKCSPSSRRFNALKARWKENPSPDYWRGVIERLNRSAFATGRTGRGWTATLDWILRPDSSSRVLEGSYDGKPTLVPLTDEEKAKIPGWSIVKEGEV